MTISIEKFDPDRRYSGQKSFDCGHPTIDRFVRNSLKQQARKKLSVAWVLVDSADSDRLGGFYTLTQHMIPLDRLTQMQLGSLPRQVPCTRLVMLGVDRACQGQALGRRLMKHALGTVKDIAGSVGSAGLYLDADPKAVGFYSRLGFHLLEGDKSPEPSPMFISLSAIA